MCTPSKILSVRLIHVFHVIYRFVCIFVCLLDNIPLYEYTIVYYLFIPFTVEDS